MALSLDYTSLVKQQSFTACLLRSNLELIWSTYFGGNDSGRGAGLSYSPSDERLYFCGGTTTNNSLLSPSDNFLPNFDFDENNLNDYWQEFPFQDTDLPAWVAFFEVDVLNDPNLSTENVIETSNQNIRIYPNPVNDFLFIKSTHIIEYLSVMNISGQEVYHTKVNTSQTCIPVNQLSKGVYLIKVKTKDGVMTQKFVKQ